MTKPYEATDITRAVLKLFDDRDVSPSNAAAAMSWITVCIIANKRDTVTQALDALRELHLLQEQLLRTEFGRVRYPESRTAEPRK